MSLDNPLKQPAPTDPQMRVKVFARDLAYGAIRDYWGAWMTVESFANRTEWLSYSASQDPTRVSIGIDAYIKDKWQSLAPPVQLLLAQGYVTLKLNSTNTYYLTEKAFDLLDEPVVTPNVFISYKRSESSALGLLVEARLKLVDRNISVFIDKQIEPGDDWENVLKERVQTARVFVALIAPDTLTSIVTRQEIEWALGAQADDASYRIMQICHGGYTMTADNPLAHKHAVLVQRETAEDYDRAIGQLINTLGYSTL